ncbi:MAG: 5-oxoprolinase subunit PxpB [Granulosicoccus sp.]|nr:5-oxoprolinase subunit PxpB [Granulosicoccus sp.]
MTPPPEDWTFRPAGDRTLVLEFGQIIDGALVDQVIALDARIRSAVQAGEVSGIVETTPTFRSLAVIFDPLMTTPAELLEQIRTLDYQHSTPPDTQAQHWTVPVLYGGDAGPDLASVAQQTGLTTERVIELHQQTRFKVYMLGFLPGFAFLGDTPAPLHLPRRREPRLRVPAGSVAIAMQLTGVYPWDSPGGWHILGNCPVPLFDGHQSPPALFKTGDTVNFTAIEKEPFNDIRIAVESGAFLRSSLTGSRR